MVGFYLELSRVCHVIQNLTFDTGNMLQNFTKTSGL